MPQELTDEYWKELLSAVRHNEAEKVQQLIADVDVDVLSKHQYGGKGSTLLLEAVHLGYEETMDVLLAKGIDVNVTSKSGEKVLGSYKTVDAENMEKANRINKKLLAAGAVDETGQYTKSSLIEAIERNDLEEVKKIAAETDVNAENKDKKPVWSYAINKPEILKVLCGAGLNLDFPDDSGHTALMYALYINNDELAKDLIKAGADVNAKSSGSYIEGYTPLHFARSAAITEELIKAGADVNAVAQDGDTPIMGKSLDIVKVMYENGADLNSQDASGMNLMTQAALAQDIERIKFLQSVGMDINTADGNGFKPLEYAVAAKSEMGSLATQNGVFLVKTEEANAEFVQQIIDCGAKVTDSRAMEVIGQHKDASAITKILKQAQKNERALLKKNLQMQSEVADKKMEYFVQQYYTEEKTEQIRLPRQEERAFWVRTQQKRG